MEIRKLNTLRFLAASIVFISHYNFCDRTLNWLVRWSGAMGVMLFFLLSGFLMSYLYLSKSWDWIHIKKYVVARFARVIPLFFCVVLFSYYIQEVCPTFPYKVVLLSDLFSHLLLLKCSSAMWTIPVEISFYFVFILIWFFASKRPIYAIFIMLASYYIIIETGYPVFSGAIGSLKYAFVGLKHFPFFFMGVVIGHIYTKWQPSEKIKHSAFLLVLLGIPIMYPSIFGYIFNMTHDIYQSSFILLCMSLIFFVIVFFVPDKNKLMSSKLGDFLGKISYSFYLVHIPVIYAFRNVVSICPFMYLVLCFFTCLGVSTVTYYFIEKPTRKAIREKFITNTTVELNFSFLNRLFSKAHQKIRKVSFWPSVAKSSFSNRTKEHPTF